MWSLKAALIARPPQLCQAHPGAHKGAVSQAQGSRRGVPGAAGATWGVWCPVGLDSAGSPAPGDWDEDPEAIQASWEWCLETPEG